MHGASDMLFVRRPLKFKKGLGVFVTGQLRSLTGTIAKPLSTSHFFFIINKRYKGIAILICSQIQSLQSIIQSPDYVRANWAHNGNSAGKLQHNFEKLTSIFNRVELMGFVQQNWNIFVLRRLHKTRWCKSCVLSRLVLFNSTSMVSKKTFRYYWCK